MVFIIWASALTLSSALASWRSPITALKSVSPASTTDVPTSPVTMRLTAAAASSTICMKSRYWRTNAWKPDSVLLAGSRLGPLLCNRDAASAVLSPTATSTPSRCATSLASTPATDIDGRTSACVTVVLVSRGCC